MLETVLVSKMDQDSTFRGHSFGYWSNLRLNGQDEERWEAIEAIRHICHPDTSIPLFLDTLCNDKYWRARALAAHALYDLVAGPQPAHRVADALPQLRKAAHDPSANVREQVTELLEILAAISPNRNETRPT